MTADEEAELADLEQREAETALQPLEEPPVVARLIVEIRSDGTRTIARGAIEDVDRGHKVAIEARGSSPISLALSLARAMFAAPALARTAVRALLPPKKKN